VCVRATAELLTSNAELARKLNEFERTTRRSPPSLGDPRAHEPAGAVASQHRLYRRSRADNVGQTPRARNAAVCSAFLSESPLALWSTLVQKSEREAILHRSKNDTNAREHRAYLKSNV
jgi:hypothetical protein